MLPPLKPIAMRERVSMVFIEKGQTFTKTVRVPLLHEEQRQARLERSTRGDEP